MNYSKDTVTIFQNKIYLPGPTALHIPPKYQSGTQRASPVNFK
jgi:hypothetical protein